MQGHLVNLLYVALFSFSFLFMITPQRQFLIQVDKVIDGDSIVDSYGTHIRLAHIDAPEIDQFSLDKVQIGINSRDFLIRVLKDQRVKVKVLGKGYFGRNLVIILVNDMNVNELMIRSGHAVSYKKKYLYLEYISRKKKLGMWKTSGFYYPKVYRKLKKRLTKKN